MSVLIETHLTHLQAAGYSPHTIHDRWRLLNAADRALPYGIDEPTTEELATFLANPSWAAWTRATYFRHLAGFYRWATSGRNPRLDWDPCAELTKPKNPDNVPNPVTDDELARALTGLDERWQLVVVLAAFAGLRVSEIARLRRQDITEDTVTIWQGKGRRDAKLPTHPEIWRRVKDLPAGLIMPNLLNGKQLDSDYLTSHARILFDALGMPDVHLHRFRHWYATMLLRAGNDIRTVQELMRHRSLISTAGYTKVADEQRRLAISTLPVPSSHQQEAA